MYRRLRIRSTGYKYEVLNVGEDSEGLGELRHRRGLLKKMGLALTALIGLAILTTYSTAQSGTTVDPTVLDACPGYEATNVATSANSLTANLVLAGEGCNVFGEDVKRLSLQVTYETRTYPVHMSI